MKKVLFVTTISGFLQQFEMNDVTILQEMGYEVHYASNFYNPVYEVNKTELRKKGIVLHQVGIQKSPVRLKANLKALFTVRTLIKKEKIEIAALTLPTAAAPEMADVLVSCGIKAIWNFTHTDLNVPRDVVVENVHLFDSLMRLSYNLSNYEKDV